MSSQTHKLTYERGSLTVQNGTLTFLSHDGTALLSACSAGIETSNGVRYATNDRVSVVEEDGTTIRVKSLGTNRKPELRWYVELEADAASTVAHLWLEVENTTRLSLPIERFDVLVAPGGFRDVPAVNLEVAQTGWQSWSYATPPVPFAEQRRNPPPVFGPMLPPSEAERTLLPWMTLVRAREGGSMLAGFTTARSQLGLIAIQPAVQGHRFTASTYAEGKLLQPGAILRSERLLLAFNMPEVAGLDLYARELGSNMGARKWPHVPTGWCSWYQFFTEVTQEDILRNLDYLAAMHNSTLLEYIQIDDGYQAEVGDWLTVNRKFPSGMRSLAERITQRGFKPGIWLAPFLVHERSQVYAEHPDWILRDRQEQPVVALWNWDGYNYALDTTHPEVDQWLRKVIGTMVEEWGYEYLKIDFIYAAALRGVRHDRQSTSVEAYRRGLELIREVAGDRFVLGCGAPFAPSVGLVDGMRIGPDVAPSWGNPSETGSAQPQGLHRAVRSTLANAWMHGQLWANDPDCLMLRARQSELTEAEVQSWSAIVALSGGMVLLSDDMGLLESEQERVALLARTLPPSNLAPVPLGPHVDGIASRAQLTVERSWEHWLIAALFNWGEQEVEVVFNPTDWDMPGELYHLYDLFSGQHLGPLSGSADLALLPVHGVRLLAAHEDAGRPQFVGSTLHLLGGVVELSEEAWADDTLTLGLNCPGERTGDLAVYIPPGFRYKGVDTTAETVTIHMQGKSLLVISLRLVNTALITIQFTREGAQG